MQAIPPEELPLPQRLALSYAPRSTRAQWLTLFAFDARLAQFVAQASEPLLAQMRLAWWRDMLGKPKTERPVGDPILEALGECFAGSDANLIKLVDGWEALLVDPPLPQSAALEFANGRAAVIAALTKQGTDVSAHAARRWALVDLAIGCSDERDRELCLTLANAEDQKLSGLPRSLRPLSVLDALAMRCLRNGAKGLLADRGSAALAMRVGLFGR